MVSKIFKENRTPEKLYGAKLFLKQRGSFLAEYMNVEEKDLSTKELKFVRPTQPRFHILKNEIPILYSEEGEVVCLPRTTDPWTIGFVGDKRTGKTNSQLNYAGAISDFLNEPVFMANDRNELSRHWIKKCENPEYIRRLSLVGEKPRPLRVVQLYPSKKNFILPIEREVNRISVALPWIELLNNFEKYFTLKGSEKYFKRLIPELMGKEDIEDILKTLNIRLKPIAKGHVASKVIAELESLFYDKFLDITNKEVVNEIIVEKEIIPKSKKTIKHKFPTLFGLMYCNLIPTLMTGNLTEREMDIYMNNFLLQVYDNQLAPGYFKDNKKVIHIMIDEVQVLERRYEKTRETIGMMATEGGNRRLGLGYCAQKIHLLPDDLTGETQYALIFQQSDQKSLKKLGDLFSLDNFRLQEIKTLNPEEGEAIISTKQKLHIYDPISNTHRYIRNTSIRGIYLPPMCHTEPPQEMS